MFMTPFVVVFGSKNRTKTKILLPGKLAAYVSLQTMFRSLLLTADRDCCRHMLQVLPIPLHLLRQTPINP